MNVRSNCLHDKNHDISTTNCALSLIDHVCQSHLCIMHDDVYAQAQRRQEDH